MIAKPTPVHFGVVLTTFAVVGFACKKEPLVIGVSWSNFQQDRWKRDESAMKVELERLGATYISTDASASSQKQNSDIEDLIARGAKVLIILAWDSDAIGPGIAKAKEAGVPVLGYDRLIEEPGVFYLTFDNKEVGRIQAREVLRAQPKGNYALIKGAPTDPNSDLLRAGQLEVLEASIKRGDVKIVAEAYTEGWRADNAQATIVEALKANTSVDAVIASNDETAGGVVAALSDHGLAGKVPVSGQDGDQAALNRVAKGLQTVSVWKDAWALGKEAARIAVALGRGTPAERIEGAISWAEGPRGVTMNAIMLKPVPVTRKNLDVVIEGGWVLREVVCEGVAHAPPTACL